MDAVQTGAKRLVGQSVTHKAFGSGVIEELTGNVVTVNFSQGEKKFIYPDAFEQFLHLDDNESFTELKKAMDARRRKIQAKELESKEKDEKRKRIRSIKIVANSHAVFRADKNEIKEFQEKGWVFTGRYASGFSEGRARTAGRLKPNSLCLLTSLEKGMDESQRTLRAAFMVQDDFYGEEHYDGQVPAHTKYCIIPGSGHEFKLWQHVDEKEVPKRFGGPKFRYISEEAAKSILLALKDEMDDKKKLMDEFYEYFCRVNKLSV